MAPLRSSSSSSRTLSVSQILVLWMVAVAAGTAEGKPHKGRRRRGQGYGVGPEEFSYVGTTCRAHVASVTDFGAVGDGETSNTEAFRTAVGRLAEVAGDGGAMLVVPPGKWLTGPFSLTSHFTLFLHHQAVILASQDINEWPIIAPLPSYGRGRDLPGGRYSNFIMGSNLTDVVITGHNGTIDGQGQFWWDKFRNNELNWTRGYIFEVMYSDQVIISNVTFANSPAWNLHPVYSSNIVVSSVTVLAPIDSPNTDGIDPDSCSDVLIENSFVISGDDCIAIKSGWDEYGIAVNMPSQRIVIRNFTCVSPDSAVIALGSEMSGGIRDIRATDISGVSSESGVRIKTAIGRGAYIKDIFLRGMTMKNTIRYVFWMAGSYGQHPDDNYDPYAIPIIDNINYNDVYADNVTVVGRLEGLPNHMFTGVCMSNVRADLIKSKKPRWNCTDIEGVTSNVSPAPCALLRDMGPDAKPCPFPTDSLPIESFQLKQCSYKSADL